MWMKKEKDLGVFKRFILPSLAIICCGFTIFAAIYAHGITPYKEALKNGEFSCPIIFYLIIFAAVMLIGVFFYSPIRNKIFKKKAQ
jgi:APA family basic amino acid/polyamine antiporter